MATRAADAVFVDTNVLIYAQSINSSLYAAARSRIAELELRGARLWISRQVVREILAVVTRTPESWPSTSLADWLRAVRCFERGFEIADDDAAVTARLLELMEAPGAHGKQVHDANIVATMLRHGIPALLTHNTADFARYAALITVLPLIPQ